MRREDNKNTVFADIMTSLSKYFIAIVAIMILVIAFSGVKFVKSGNVALILRFGNLVGDTYEE
jgi:regulator of protease activity HflC (stomatin/prohibitin superfamily)